MAQARSARQFELIQVSENEHSTLHAISRLPVIFDGSVTQTRQAHEPRKLNLNSHAQQSVQNAVSARERMQSRIATKEPKPQGVHTSVFKKSRMEGNPKLGEAVITCTSEPPTVKELQRIAEDIRRGLY